jgi:putative hemolysin
MSLPLSLAILLAVLIVLSAAFSAAEAAFIAMNKIRLRHLKEEKVRGAERVYGLVGRLDQLITTLLIGNNLVNIAIASISTAIFISLLGPQWGVTASTFVVAVVLLVVCEITPKIFATNHPEFVAFGFRHVVSFLLFVMTPLAHLATRISSVLIRLVGGKPRYRAPLVSEEEIKLMIRLGKEEGYYGDQERRMLERIFYFDDTEVKDVMTPFERMVMIDVAIPEGDLANLLMEKGHNRIPVYEKEPQNVIGILYVHDLLYLMKNHELINMRDLLSAPYFVPPEKKVAALLREFQSRKVQIALVRDAAGKILGLVTLEDLFEEIVGEIEEHTPLME